MATYDPYGNSGLSQQNPNEYNQQANNQATQQSQMQQSQWNQQQRFGGGMTAGGAGGPPQPEPQYGTDMGMSRNATMPQQGQGTGTPTPGGQNQPGWGQPGGPDWSVNQPTSGEGPNPYWWGQPGPQGQPAMPGTFMDYLAAPPEQQAAMQQWLPGALSWASTYGNLASQQAGDQLSRDQFNYQTGVADPWQRGFAEQQFSDQQQARAFQEAMQRESFTLDSEMANRGMRLQERQQVHQQAHDLARLDLDDRALSAQIDNMAAQLGLSRDTLHANVMLKKQELSQQESQFGRTLAQQESEFGRTLGQQESQFGRTLSQQDKHFMSQMGFNYDQMNMQDQQVAKALAENARQANQQASLAKQGLQQAAHEFAQTHGLNIQQVANTKWFQEQQARIADYEAQTTRQLGQAANQLRSRELSIGEYQFGQQLGWEQSRFGQELGQRESEFGRQMSLEQQRLAEQARQANLQAVGRVQAPNTRWLRRS